MASSVGSSSSTKGAPLDANTTIEWCNTRTRFKRIKINYRWTIDNFSSCVVEMGDFIKSPIFSANPKDEKQPKWQLGLYPKGKDEESKDYVALYLFLKKCDKSPETLTAKHKLTVVNAKGKKTKARSGANKFEQGHGWGYAYFAWRGTLLDPKRALLPEGRLTIFCQILFDEKFKEPVPSDELMMAPPVPQTRLSTDMGALLQSGLFADCVLCSDGQEFKVHKVVLACRSPVFSAMFEHNMQESNTNKVDIEDVTAPVLGQLLHFVYTGETPPLLDEQDMAEALLAAADKYQLDQLKAMCELQLSIGLNKDNVCATLVLADLQSAEHLKTSAIEFMNLHEDEAMESEGWRAMACSHRERVLLKQLFRHFSLALIQNCIQLQHEKKQRDLSEVRRFIEQLSHVRMAERLLENKKSEDGTGHS